MKHCFRAYNKATKEWFYFNLWGSGGKPWPNEKLCDVVVMEASELKSKDGEILYEGDVVVDTKSCAVYEVVKETFAWAMKKVGVRKAPDAHELEIERAKWKDYTSPRFCDNHDFPGRFDLVGNIWDSPELGK